MREKQAQSEAEVPQKRLLEESPAPPRSARKPAADAPAASPKTHNTKEDIRSPTSSEPHPGMSEEHEVANHERGKTMTEGALSQITKKPSPPAVQSNVNEKIEKFDELAPKA
jgi:hypothetical protein